MDPRKKRRIEELLRREVSNIVLYEMRDPRVRPVTLTHVELSEDQRSARVFLIVRGTPEETDESLRTLGRARGYVQALVGDRLKLRYTPVLSFREDEDALNAMRVQKLIDATRSQDRELPDLE